MSKKSARRETSEDSDQPLPEPETIAKDEGTGDEDVPTAEEAPDDQPKHEIEAAARAKAQQAADASAEAGERTNEPIGGVELKPGEAIAAPRAAAPLYEFLPGDGQAEAQNERIAKFQEEQASQAEQSSNDESRDDSEEKA